MAPTPKARALGNILRQARVDRGLTSRGLADLIGCSQAQISKWENGESVPKPEKVAQILANLGVNGSDFEHAVNLAHGVNSSSWIAMSLPAQRPQLEALTELESTATKIVSVSPLLIPGLLQTEEYSRAIMEAGMLPSYELATRLAIRIGRKHVITRKQNPVQYTAFIGPAAIRKVIGSAEVMVDQCKHLMDMARRPNIDILIIAPDAGWNPSDEGLYDIVESSEHSGVVILESRRSSLIFHERDDVLAYQQATDMVRQVAMSPQESLRHIVSVAKRMEKDHAVSHLDQVQ